MMLVPIAIGDAAAVEDHRMVEQTRAAFLHFGKSVDEIRQMPHVVAIDLGNLLDLFLVFTWLKIVKPSSIIRLE